MRRFPQDFSRFLGILLAVSGVVQATLAFTRGPLSVTDTVAATRLGRNTPVVYSTKLQRSVQKSSLSTARLSNASRRHYQTASLNKSKLDRRPRSIALIPLTSDGDAEPKEVAQVVQSAAAATAADVSIDTPRASAKELASVVPRAASQTPHDTTSTDPFTEKDSQNILNQKELDQIRSEFNLNEKESGVQGETVFEVPSMEGDVLAVEDELIALDSPVIRAKEENNASVARVEEKEEETALTTRVPPERNPPTARLSKQEWDANVVCAQAFAAVNQHPILLFDGACNLCSDWVNFCLDYDVQAKFRFASLQSKVGQSILVRDGRPPNDCSDIILATPQETFAKTDAVLRVVSQLEGLPIVLRVMATLARILLPPWFRDALYKFIGSNRHIFGHTEGPVCRLDFDGEFIGRFIEDPELEDFDDTLGTTSSSTSESEEHVCVSRR